VQKEMGIKIQTVIRTCNVIFQILKKLKVIKVIQRKMMKMMMSPQMPIKSHIYQILKRRRKRR
jgi:hypothetical protein